MIDLVSVLALGFFLGMRHATDPDHVLAVSTLVSRHQNPFVAAWIGIFWGFGHTITICAVGTGIIFGGWVIPVRAGLAMELAVGLMLIALGLVNVLGLPGLKAPHAHADHHHRSHATAFADAPQFRAPLPTSHAPASVVAASSWQRWTSGARDHRLIRPVVVGIVHGLAGSAAIALLVLATIRDPRWAIAYLLVFGLGTVAGMMTITAAISLPFFYTRREFTRLNGGLRIATSLLSVAFGCFLTYEIGFVGGLFTAHPHWTPR